MKDLAIIITAYKAEKFILETINAFKNQSIPNNWNLDFFIGVDACKTTANLLSNNNISYYFCNENVGTYVLTNSLIKKALNKNTDAFLRFDSDDVPCKNFLYNGIMQLKSADFVQPYRIICNENLKPETEPEIADGPAFFTKNAIDLIGGYDHYRVACDGFFSRRAKKLGLTKELDKGKPLYFYRNTANSLTKNSTTGKDSIYRKTVKAQMRKEFKSGKLKIDNPVTVPLQYIKSE